MNEYDIYRFKDGAWHPKGWIFAKDGNKAASKAEKQLDQNLHNHIKHHVVLIPKNTTAIIVRRN